MPASAVNVLNAELNKVLKSPDVVKVLADDGGVPIGGSPDSFRKLISTEIERWKRLVKVGGIKPPTE